MGGSDTQLRTRGGQGSNASSPGQPAWSGLDSPSTSLLLPEHRNSHSSAGSARLGTLPLMLGLVALCSCLVVLAWSSGRVGAHGLADPRMEQLAATIERLEAAMHRHQDAVLQQLNASAAAQVDSSSEDDGAGGETDSVGNRQETTDAGVPAAMAAIPSLTKLHNAVLRSSHDFKAHRQTMARVLDELVHLKPEAAKRRAEQGAAAAGAPPLERFVHELYGLLLSTGKLIPCREDATLVAGDTALAPPGAAGPAQPRYFFATNLRDNSVGMPQFTLSLLQTLLRLPQDAAFVSAYESNSEDGAHGWIDVLQLALNVIGTPSRLVTRGMLVRLDGSDRIEFLAQVRNMALAPLYSHYRGVPSNASAGSGDAGVGALAPGVLPWSPDYVVFINDVFFCWSMVLRLMNYRADMTCGMDWWQHHDATAALPHALRDKQHKPKPRIPAEYRLEHPLKQAMSSDQVNPLVFYDIWVARDIEGSKFWWAHPFVNAGDNTRAATSGLPFRASCCWNGLTVLRAAPFARGLRVRAALEGECRASECSLLCNDFARLGYDYVVVDAGVQVAYDWEAAREMMAAGIEGVGQATWAQAKAAGVAARHTRPAYANTECCSLRKGAAWVSFFSDCFREDIFARNYTATAFEQLWARPPQTPARREL